MATLKGCPTIDLKADLWLNENEVRFLHRIAGYNHNLVRQGIESITGKLEDYEAAGCMTLLAACRDITPTILGRVDDARDLFNGQKKGVPNKS